MSTAVQVVVDGGSVGVGRDRVAAARVLARSLSSAVPVRVLEGPDGGRDDPYQLTSRLPGMDADAVVLVAPRRRGPRGLSPGPAVDGRPVALVLADRPGHLARSLPDPDAAAPWVVAAMARNVFLDATADWALRLRTGGHAVVDLRADRARRGDLVTGWQAGPRVVLYAGHGRPHGWAGYQALRFHHLSPGIATPADRAPAAIPHAGTIEDPEKTARAVGLVVAFACDTLGRAHNQWPFGVALVESGMVRAYLGPASTVSTADATALSTIVLGILAHDHPSTVTDLVRAVDGATAGDAAARRAWLTFRLVGAPDTIIA